VIFPGERGLAAELGKQLKFITCATQKFHRSKKQFYPESLMLASQIGVGQSRAKPVLFQPVIQVHLVEIRCK
jgi:hypothetical protein